MTFQKGYKLTEENIKNRDKSLRIVLCCEKCKKEEFIRTGLRQKYCKECEKEVAREKRNKWKRNNPNKVKEYHQKYYQKNKDILNERKERWREKNPERYKKYGKEYREKNKEHRKEYYQKYKQTERGKEVSRKCAETRRERKKAIIEVFTKEEWYKKLLATKGICLKCKKYVSIDKLTLEHIYPVMKAYNDFLKTGIKRIYKIKDVRPLCRSCNHHKGKL